MPPLRVYHGGNYDTSRLLGRRRFYRLSIAYRHSKFRHSEDARSGVDGVGFRLVLA